METDRQRSEPRDRGCWSRARRQAFGAPTPPVDRSNISSPRANAARTYIIGKLFGSPATRVYSRHTARFGYGMVPRVLRRGLARERARDLRSHESAWSERP